MAEYEAFSKELANSLDARTPLERELAQTITDQLIRSVRTNSFF
jgi:hypothetical protein